MAPVSARLHHSATASRRYRHAEAVVEQLPRLGLITPLFRDQHAPLRPSGSCHPAASVRPTGAVASSLRRPVRAENADGRPWRSWKRQPAAALGRSRLHRRLDHLLRTYVGRPPRSMKLSTHRTTYQRPEGRPRRLWLSAKTSTTRRPQDQQTRLPGPAGPGVWARSGFIAETWRWPARRGHFATVCARSGWECVVYMGGRGTCARQGPQRFPHAPAGRPGAAGGTAARPTLRRTPPVKSHPRLGDPWRAPTNILGSWRPPPLPELVRDFPRR